MKQLVLSEEIELEVEVRSGPGTMIAIIIYGKDNGPGSIFFTPELYPGVEGEIIEVYLDGDPITCMLINEEIIFEGDIILTNDQIDYSSSLKGATINRLQTWEDNIVYFTFDPGVSLDLRDTIMTAMEDWESKTTVKFQQRSDQENYVIFEETKDRNGSKIGMRGGSQVLKLQEDAWVWLALHEIGHCLGLMHEHSRSDRDDYVTIHWENIEPPMWPQFRIRYFSRNLTSFDRSSIMLYGSYVFSWNNKGPTITMIYGGVDYQFIQAQEISQTDIESIKELYPPRCTFTDPRDGQTYKWVEIGEQVWMAENLRANIYSDGSAIPLVESSSSWAAMSFSEKAYCWVDNNIDNRDPYGGLYTWGAAMNGAVTSSSNPSGVQGVCPDGWHMPSDAEWTELTNYLGGRDIAGGKLKETGTTHWNSPNTGATNESGFSAVGGGSRHYNGTFVNFGIDAPFWSSTQAGSGYAWNHVVSYDHDDVNRGYGTKTRGRQVRCVKD